MPTKYLDFADIFSKKSTTMVLKQTNINEHAIDLKKDKRSPYKPIYSLKSIELKILIIYIKTNLA